MNTLIAQLRSATDLPAVAQDSFSWWKIAIPIILICVAWGWIADKLGIGGK